MMANGPNPYARLRALVALLMLVAGWASTPAALINGPPPVCSMACCIEEGFCCCNPAQPYIEGRIPQDEQRIYGEQIANTCPDGCATPQSSNFPVSRDTARAAAHTDFSIPVVSKQKPLQFIRGPVERGPSSPRSPPLV
ncbi:MAG: hypothetical protein L0229_25120 [Blastocatellia bacterium]|nr:hypothetical protein [Blastocatellia bacterium]